MRKYNFILMAFALLLGMAQCKKEPATPNGDNNGGARITLKVDDGDNGQKLNVYPATGAVIFTQGDEIYVGNNGKYVGTLTFDNGLFQGTVSGDLSTNDYLHFYFVGNKPTSPSTLTSGNTTYTVDISDQSAGLPAISYAPSTAKYSPSTTAYTAKLLNKSALVMFAPSLPTNQSITISDMKNKVTIDFANHTLAPTGTTGGITLYSVSDTEKWAILLAQDAVSNATVTISGYAATASVPPITNNMYYNTGVGIAMTATVPAGAIDGKFTINSNGDQVYFSKGNLQYIGSAATPYWKFADNQWGYLGNNGQGSTATNVDRDLFGYGTSGYDNGQTCWQPYSTTANASYYYSGNLSGNADWGYNAIHYGAVTIPENSGWRTPSKDEWVYVFNTRSASTVNDVANARYAMATVNNVKGIMVFPDVYTHPAGVTAPSNINVNNAAFSSNNYTGDDWTAIEANGVLFLPAAGYRQGTTVYQYGSFCDYWSSSYKDGNYAYLLNLSDQGLRPDNYDVSSLGLSVRLVHNAQ